MTVIVSLNELDGFTPMLAKRVVKGFTLAELLIALAILGVIAIFTIPKVIQAQQSQQRNAVTKETIAAINGAFLAWKDAQGYNSGYTGSPYAWVLNFTPYLNYVSLDSKTVIDGPLDCSSGGPCVKLTSGALIYQPNYSRLCGTSNVDSFYYAIDTDGTQNGIPNLWVYQYFDGRVMTSSGILAGTRTCNHGIPIFPAAGTDPTWFSWN